MSVNSLKNRVKNTVYTVFALCRDYVFSIFEKIQSLCIFVKTLYVHTMYISTTEFHLPGYRNRETFEFIFTHCENFIPTLRILQLDSLSRLAKDLCDPTNLFFGAYDSNITPRGTCTSPHFTWTIPTLHFTTKFLPSFLYPFSSSLNILIEHFCALWLKLKYKFGVVVQLPQKP